MKAALNRTCASFTSQHFNKPLSPHISYWYEQEKKWFLTRKMTNSPNQSISPATSIYTISPSIVTPSAPQTRRNWQDTVFSDNATSLIHARFHRALWFLACNGRVQFYKKKNTPRNLLFKIQKIINWQQK